jgi:hypothetical protein
VEQGGCRIAVSMCVDVDVIESESGTAAAGLCISLQRRPRKTARGKTCGSPKQARNMPRRSHMRTIKRMCVRTWQWMRCRACRKDKFKVSRQLWLQIQLAQLDQCN